MSMGFDREQSKNALEAVDVGAKDAGYPQESMGRPVDKLGTQPTINFGMYQM